MDGGIALSCLSVEHRSWRMDHPHGFVARPETIFDGAVNLMVWHCFIPGKPTEWSPAMTVKQILVGIQYLLDQPNLNNPAQIEGYNIYIQVNTQA
ncbi:hypothetical protein MTR67_031386 [Solanum verrucosum]|uniref:UBC core domain-containing protein n=1 Tax=Solanum verrucosum TaxID=315347 RepID=A0AAF0U2F9_SOLVR|nr:hypothetical protein MTR67_031386 [Solanum verrucosum]